MKKYNLNKLLMFILLQSMLFITSSCKKNLLSTKLEGEVVGLTELAPIQGATVTVYREQSGGLMMPSTYEVVMQTQTDPKGKFYLDFKQEPGEYSVYVRKEGYFNEEDMRGVESYCILSEFGNVFKKKKRLYLQEPAYLDLTLSNISNYDSTFSIGFVELGLKNGTIFQTRCSKDNKSNCCFIIPANKIFNDNYQIYNKNGQISSGKLSVPPARPFSTINYELKY